MLYDPRQHGALCDRCVLSRQRSGDPVQPDYHVGADKVIVVGEAPGAEEVSQGVPFIGASGQEAQVAFGSYGLGRGEIHWTNACLCRPPENKMEVIDKMTAALNVKAKKETGITPWLRPWQACRPRLLRELAQHRNCIALGGLALKAVANDEGMSITKMRGFPLQLGLDTREGAQAVYTVTPAVEGTLDWGILHRLTVMPTLHPAFVLRQRRWTKIYRADIGRGLRVFRNEDTWVPPDVVYQPSVAQVRDFLLGQRLPFWVHDVETDAKYPLKARLRCIGFSDTQRAIVIPFLGIDGYSTFYTEDEQAEINDILRTFYTDRTRAKAGWNSGYYDRIVIRRVLGVTPKPELDGILLHRVVDSELPHNLGFVASCWTEVPRAWKKDHTATDPHSDMDLWIYNALDNVLTARCINPLWEAVEEKQQVKVVQMDHQVQVYCVHMHENGLAVDQKRRAEREFECLNGEPVMRPDDVLRWQKKVDAGQMSKADFDKKVEKRNKMRAKLLKEVFDKQTGLPEEVLTDPLHYVREPDGVVKKKGLLHYRTTLQTIAEGLGVHGKGKDGRFNPASNDQVAQVLFDKWGYHETLNPGGFTAEAFTDSGKVKTGDEVLLQLMADMTNKEGKVGPSKALQYQFCDALRWFRRLAKELGTYILKFKLENEIRDPALAEIAIDLEESEDEKDQAKWAKIVANPNKWGCVSLDGRLHAGWNSHTAACVTGKTWVLTGQGPRRMADVAAWGPPGTAMKPDDTFSLHDGEHRRHVEALINSGVVPTLKVKTVLGFELEGPAHHRIQVAERAKFMHLGPRDATGYRKNTAVSPNWTWRRLGSVFPGDYARVIIGTETWGTSLDVPTAPAVPKRTNAVSVNLPSKLTEDLAFFVGAYNADGSLHDANGSFAIRISNIARRNEVAGVARRLFGSAAVRVDDVAVMVTSVALKGWAAAFGLGRRIENKSAPAWLLSAPRRFVVAYLRGLFFDSHLTLAAGVTAEWMYTGTRTLCGEVQALLLNMGIVTALADKMADGHEKTWCAVASSKSDVEAICAITGQSIPAPTRRGASSRPKYIRRGNVLWLRVTRVEAAGDQQVYDVTVPTSERYWSNGFISHNTGRLSSSDPVNDQNIPAHLRDMIIPGPGHEFVTADMDQVELRRVASLAGASQLLEVFNRIYKKRKSGQKVDKLNPVEDPYSMNAAAIFGGEFTRAAADSKDKLRTFAKIFTLASIYGADPIVKWGILRSSEDKEGRLVYLKLSQREVRKFHDEWCKANPEIVRWWSDVWAEFKAQGYLIDPVIGRRRDFLDDGDEDEVKKEVYNFKAQAGCAAAVHQATMRIVDNLIPFQKWGPGTGLVAQVHDSLTFEVPIGLGKALVPQVEEMMESRDENVVYTASGLVQQHWGMK